MKKIQPDSNGNIYVTSSMVKNGKFCVEFPKEIKGGFYCYNNQLTSLEYAPQTV